VTGPRRAAIPGVRKGRCWEEMDRPLHPNLARIAAAYDDVMADFRAQRIGPAEARRRVLTLLARDDNGLEWSIDPDTGAWRYRNQFGEMVTANPPAYGVAGFTPTDLGAGRGDDPRVRFYEVDQDALRAEGQLRGSTGVVERRTDQVRGVVRRIRPALLLVAAGGACLLLLRTLGTL